MLTQAFSEIYKRDCLELHRAALVTTRRALSTFFHIRRSTGTNLIASADLWIDPTLDLTLQSVHKEVYAFSGVPLGSHFCANWEPSSKRTGGPTIPLPYPKHVNNTN